MSRGGKPRSRRALAWLTPGSLHSRTLHSNMSNMHLLSYAISRRTPPSPKALKSVLDVQNELNHRLSWPNERLTLAPERPAARVPLAFPFIRIAPSRPMFGLQAEQRADAPHLSRIEDAFASGTTRVKNLLNAHYVVAFLKLVSKTHPELLLQLRDDGGTFVQPGAVWIQNGKVELDRQWLNRERERALEMTGDPQAAGPFVWAEAEALEGRFFQAASASDFAEVPEVAELNLTWERLDSTSVEDIADFVVQRATESVVPVAA